MQAGLKLQTEGSYAAAKRQFQMALSATHGFSPDDPRQSMTRNALGIVSDSLGEYGEAEGWHRATVAFAERTLGSRNAELAIPLANLGNVLLERGKVMEAEGLCRRALELLNGDSEPRQEALALTLGTLGAIARRRGDLEVAERLLEQAASTAENRAARAFSVYPQILQNLALVYQGRGEFRQALSTLDRAYTFIEGLHPRHPETFHLVTAMAELEIHLGNREEAIRHFERARQIAEQSFGPNHRFLAYVLTREARLLRKLQRRKEARDLEIQARACLSGGAKENIGSYTADVRDLSAWRR